MVSSLQTLHFQEVQARDGQSNVPGLKDVSCFSAEPHTQVCAPGGTTCLGLPGLLQVTEVSPVGKS